MLKILKVLAFTIAMSMPFILKSTMGYIGEVYILYWIGYLTGCIVAPLFIWGEKQ